jgi:hypothetical protein
MIVANPQLALPVAGGRVVVRGGVVVGGVVVGRVEVGAGVVVVGVVGAAEDGGGV